ncbi:hypothetical protein ACFJGX_11925 [Hydrogenophaga sp. UC242_50]
MTQTLLAVRAIEVAAKKHGPDKLSGELIYTTLLETTFPAKDFFGLTGGDLDFSVEAPFPTKDPRINIGQVVGGKLTTVRQGRARAQAGQVVSPFSANLHSNQETS